jgi:hypothetical protein
MAFQLVSDLNRSRLRKAIRLASFPWRRATSAWRILPSALIIGAQKGGTSSLHYILSLHPDIGASRPKEQFYFSNRYDRDIAWYRAGFPLRRAGVFGLESSAGYLLHPHAPARAKADLPGVKIIALLRDPVERAYSNWQHTTRHGNETLPFEEAVDREGERTDALWKEILACTGRRSSPELVHGYLRRGHYAEQLQRWYEHFPRSDVLLLRSEDFYADPRSTVLEVLRWLGLRETIPDDLSARNTGGGYAKLRPELRDKLRRYFEPHNQELLRLTGRDFKW